MPIDPQEFAKMLGAEIVGEVPDVGGGPFGMARLAYIMHQCLTPSRGERPGRPTNPSWVTRCKVPMSDVTLQRLTELAVEMSTDERKISPMQVAAQLLEEALSRVGVKTAAQTKEMASGPEDLASDKGTKALPASPIEGRDEAKAGPDRKTKLPESASTTGEPSLPASNKIRPPRVDKSRKASHHRKRA